jgi:hypothetical protein
VPLLLGILRHTPLWVWVLLAVLVAFGVQGLRPRVVAVWRLLVVPAVFIAWGLASLAQRVTVAPPLIVDWGIAAIVGVAIGWFAGRLGIVRIDRPARRVELSGSALPLIRNLAIFLAKYGLTAAAAIAPARAASLAHWDIAVSGLSAGFFAAWLARFALRYRGDAGAIGEGRAQPGDAA